MSTIRVLALFAGATAAIAGYPITLGAQSAPMAHHFDSDWIHLSLEKSSYAVGEKPVAVMTIENVSSDAVWYPNDRYQERIHITSKDGEPPKTELYRHFLGDFRPGDGPDLAPGPVVGRSISPGSVDSQKYDLSRYYDLSKPGEYSVYIEIYDLLEPKDGSGRWMRTNEARFEIRAPAQ